MYRERVREMFIYMYINKGACDRCLIEIPVWKYVSQINLSQLVSLEAPPPKSIPLQGSVCFTDTGITISDH